MQNRLAIASSPYLRMHAGNPVHWQPWDDIALNKARETDTPILLSIGYSACHWCHVMAHECFENPQIAAGMNRWFVCIKLDREERPDIDRVYQLAHQALSGRGGGWPLTAFLDPQNLSPFYIGTYFPPVPRHGLPGFPELLQRVQQHFKSNREELRAHAESLRNWMRQAEAAGGGSVPDADIANAKALQNVAARFDPDWGGNRGAPKFARTTELEWLLDQPKHTDARGMAHKTLATVATRGLQDHLGGGFFRYCVDVNWTIPHFEKMLYDNAQLLPLYARVAAADNTDPAVRKTATAAANGIVRWLAHDMAALNGAFCSALGADSEGEEGRFYLWNREQVRVMLPQAACALAERAFGLDHPPNFEGKEWHLLRVAPLEDIASQLGQSTAETGSEYAAVRRKLFDVRERRVHPVRDDKILVAWNALTVSGLARSARLLGDERCASMAVRALDALRESAWIDGELYANVAEPAARIPGFLDDHAFLLDALLEVMQISFNPRDLDWAITLADAIRVKFTDHESGGFWLSTITHATPLSRSRNWTDDATPNGNGVAIRSLLRLGHLVGDSRCLFAAEEALRAASGAFQHYPDACPSLLRALEEFERPRLQIVVRCPPMRRAIWQSTLHSTLREMGMAPGGDPVDAFLIPAEAGTLPGLLSARESRGETGTAYVCAGLVCQAPVTSPDGLGDALRAAATRI